MRRLVLILGIAVVVVVLGLVIGASLLNVDRFRPRLQSELQQKLGRPVQLGELHLKLFPFAVRVDGLTIGADPAIPSVHPFATASQVDASASLMSLIHGTPDIHELTLENPQIELIRNQAGVWNFSSLASNGSKSSGGGESQFTLTDLKIVDGQVAVTDQHSHSPRAVYNHIDLGVHDFSTGKPFDVTASLHLQGGGKEQIAFKGTAGPLGAGANAGVPINGHLSIEQVSLAALNAVAPGKIPAQTDGLVSGAADIVGQGAETSAKGNISVENAVFKGGKISAPISATYDVSMNSQSDQITIRSGHLQAGPSGVNVSGTVASGTTPAALNLRVGTSNASIADLLHTAALFGASSAAGDEIKGNLTTDLTVTGSETDPKIAGTLSANPLQVQQIVLTNVHSTIETQNGVVQLSPLTAGIFGGTAQGSIGANTRATPVSCAVKMHLTGADANALLSAVSSVKDKLYGSLSADTNLTFAAESGPNMARSLNGTLAFNVANGRLKGVNILNELSRVAKFTGSAGTTQSSETALSKLGGSLDIRSGVASTNNLTAAMPEGSLAGTGTLNLVNEAIDMHVNAVLASGTSKAVGGTGVGGFLNTALANNSGELVVPVVVTGTMEHPTFTPDVQAMAKMKLQHLLPTTGDPSKGAAGMVGSVLGGITGQGGNKKQQNNQPAQNPLKSILGGFGK